MIIAERKQLLYFFFLGGWTLVFIHVMEACRLVGGIDVDLQPEDCICFVMLFVFG